MSDQFRRRMMWMVNVLEEQGVSRWTSAPPFHRLAWRLGIRLRPPLYQSFSELLFGMALGFAVPWGLLMWALFWRTEGYGFREIALAAAISGLAFGLFMALYYRWKARRVQLPPLS